MMKLRRAVETRRDRTLLTLGGALLLGVGGILMLVALWLVLAAAFSPLVATLVVAVLALGAGMLVLALRPRPAPLPPLRDLAGPLPGTTSQGLAPVLLTAFAVGLRAGAVVAAACRRTERREDGDSTRPR